MKKRYSLTAGILLLSALTACGQQTTTETSDIAEEDLPYGATMVTETLDSDNGSVPITYDRRYFETEEIETLSQYFYALETGDTDLMTDATLPLYMDYVVETMYQGLIGMDGLVQAMQVAFSPEDDEAYTIQSVEITDIATEDDQNTDLENLYTMLTELSEDENYADTISNGKYLTYTIKTETEDGTSKTFTDRTMFLIAVDGKYVVCS
jgi:hypothetical protein